VLLSIETTRRERFWEYLSTSSLQDIRRIFLYIFPFYDEPWSNDRVLNLPRLRLNAGERIVVGLPGILNKKLYLLGVEGTPLLQSGREMDMHEEMLI
jgi:hypothetical protein